MFTALNINFSDAQGQITPELLAVPGSILTSIKRRNSVANLPKFKLIQAFMHVLVTYLPARMRMIDSKMKELGCSQYFSHYKSMGIFPDAQGQLTPQSSVRSSQITNSSEM